MAKSLFSTKKYWVTLVFNILLVSLIGLSFSSFINVSSYNLQTWNNTTSKYVAYDARKFSTNCYVYYGKSISFNLSEGDSIRIIADIYQFIEGNSYDEKSLLNKKNIVSGIYKELNGNEIAIPDNIAKEYSLNIGDIIYLNANIAYTIKYIFRNLYDIKKPNIDSNNGVIFIGSTIKKLSSNYTYAVFDNISKDYNEVYLFSKIINKFKFDKFLYLFIEIGLSLIVQIVITFMYKKSELSNLYKDLICGSKKRYYRSLLGVNFFIHLMPMLIASLILLILNNILISICLVISSLIYFVLKVIAYRIKIS